mmetsp:Transcript_13259/g.27221  ORF Transcript_13259/g.27221 Transcript_13259/m.27221 type:complete len:269 (+) Transcript_13259:1333-2139(+)
MQQEIERKVLERVGGPLAAGRRGPFEVLDRHPRNAGQSDQECVFRVPGEIGQQAKAPPEIGGPALGLFGEEVLQDAQEGMRVFERCQLARGRTAADHGNGGALEDGGGGGQGLGGLVFAGGAVAGVVVVVGGVGVRIRVVPHKTTAATVVSRRHRDGAPRFLRGQGFFVGATALVAAAAVRRCFHCVSEVPQDCRGSQGPRSVPLFLRLAAAALPCARCTRHRVVGTRSGSWCRAGAIRGRVCVVLDDADRIVFGLSHRGCGQHHPRW